MGDAAIDRRAGGMDQLARVGEDFVIHGDPVHFALGPAAIAVERHMHQGNQLSHFFSSSRYASNWSRLRSHIARRSATQRSAWLSMVGSIRQVRTRPTF